MIFFRAHLSLVLNYKFSNIYPCAFIIGTSEAICGILEPWLRSLSSTELLDSLIMICNALVNFCVYSYDFILRYSDSRQRVIIQEKNENQMVERMWSPFRA